MQYRIKPLVWEETSLRNHVAQCVFGDIWINDNRVIGGTWFLAMPAVRARACDTLESAKLAAESWYRERLLEALEVVQGEMR